MEEFVLLFRQPDYDYNDVPEEKMEDFKKKWQKWVEGITAQDRLVSQGQRLSAEGKVLKPGGVISDGPFVEIRERLGGFMVVKADSLEEATTLAHGCPLLEAEGSVEIRPLFE